MGTKRKKKKPSSKSYRDDSWDSEVTSEEDYRKKKSVKKSKSSKSKKSSSRLKSKPKSRKYSEDSDVEFESTKIDRKNIIEDDDDEDDVGRKNRKTRGKRTKYNLILDDSSESEAEKAKGAGKQIKNCIDSTEEEYSAKDEDDEEEEASDEPDEYDDENSKEKSDNNSGDINDQIQNDSERTSIQT